MGEGDAGIPGMPGGSGRQTCLLKCAESTPRTAVAKTKKNWQVFRQQLNRSFHLSLRDEEVKALITYFDNDGDGTVDGAEFLLTFFRRGFNEKARRTREIRNKNQRKLEVRPLPHGRPAQAESKSPCVSTRCPRSTSRRKTTKSESRKHRRRSNGNLRWRTSTLAKSTWLPPWRRSPPRQSCKARRRARHPTHIWRAQFAITSQPHNMSRPSHLFHSPVILFFLLVVVLLCCC